MNNKNGQSAAECVLVKPIKGWEGLYEIYSDGRVYSLVSNKFLKPRLSMDGYERVALCDKGKRYEYRIHRLVAEAFIENPENKPQINHKDFNKRNNFINNLEWCTNLENVHYSMYNNRIGFGN
nr:MAG TPA: homing endonuclease [Bacteriophage sp.]